METRNRCTPFAFFRNRPFILLLLLSLLLPGCEPFPRDPHGTLERIEGGVMRVGVVPAPPWSSMRSGSGDPRGFEVELVQRLAEELNAEIEWITGSESDLFTALEHFQLDLVIGGLTESSPYQTKVAFTRPFLTSIMLIGAPLGAGVPYTIEGQPVAVERTSAAATFVQKHGGEPQAHANLHDAKMLIAAEDWELDAWGFQRSRIELRSERHVIAVPRGENAWVHRLTVFLLEQPSLREHLVRAEQERIARERNEASMSADAPEIVP